jgi:hypothetical protein
MSVIRGGKHSHVCEIVQADINIALLTRVCSHTIMVVLQ